MTQLQRTVLKGADGSTISFDCVEVEDADHDAEITRYPIELGANRSDHIVLEPVAVSLTVHLTNAPMANGQSLSHMDGTQPRTTIEFPDRIPRGFKDESKRIIDPVQTFSAAGIAVVIPRPITLEMKGEETFGNTKTQASVRAWGVEGAELKRVQRVYQALLKAQAELTEFTVATEFADYDAMVIKRIGKSRGPKNPRAPKFELVLRRLEVSELERRDISSRFPKKPKQQRGKPKQDGGKQQPKPADPKTEKKSKSVLKALF